MTDALLLNDDDIRTVLAEPGATVAAVDAMEHAFVEYARAAFESPSRTQVGQGGERAGRALRILPCVAPPIGGAACRLYTMNKESDPYRPAPCELLLLFDTETMELRAVMEDYSLHALRTAAPTAVAVRHLARPSARSVAVLGSGRQARGQLAAVASVAAVGDVRVHSRDPSRRETFAEEMGAALGVPIIACPTVAEAVQGADIVLTATNTVAPVLERRLVAPGALVVSIAPGELAPDVVLGSQLVPCAADEVLYGTPRWEPVRTLVEQGTLPASALAIELGDVVAGIKTLERAPEDVTVVLSTGMAFWDLVIAHWADARARRLGLGTRLWPGGGARTGTGFAAPRVDRVGGGER